MPIGVLRERPNSPGDGFRYDQGEMLTPIDLRAFDKSDDYRAMLDGLPRPEVVADFPTAGVLAILDDVRARGDDALRALTSKFDGVDLDELRVTPDQVALARTRISGELRDALEVACAAIRDYQERSRLVASQERYERDGITVSELCIPVARAGLYAPGGRARYPSTVLMTAVPASVAGVREIVLCVPPMKDGSIDDLMLAAADLAGVNEVYRVGGAQAIAAMAFGTESIATVDVIAGPGNRYVAQAKRAVSGIVGVPSAFTGPSEVVVVADASAPVLLAAIDLVVQAEHGPDGLAWLITWSEKVLDEVTAEVTRLVASSPRNSDLVATLAKGGYAVLVNGPAEAMEVANYIAPEHLELCVSQPSVLVQMVRSAGAVFLGPNTPASLGDYVAGPSHVLPTNGSARFAGALSVEDFVKRVHVISADDGAIARLGPSVEALAIAEGLPAHAESIALRGAQGR